MPKLTLCLPPAPWGPGTLDSDCSGNIARFRWISSNHVKTRLLYRFSRNLTPTMPVLTLCLPPARWGPKAPDSECSGNIARFDGFLQIKSKLDYLYRFSRYPTPTMPVLTLCLPPARWGPKAPDSECNGDIASFRRISSNLTKTRLSIQI